MAGIGHMVDRNRKIFVNDFDHMHDSVLDCLICKVSVSLKLIM